MNTQTQEVLKMTIEQLEADVFPPLNKAYVIAKLKEALEQPAQEPVDGCGKCHACLVGVNDESGFPVTATRMILCPICGNKRCPHASNHRYACTNSNDTDQIGSIYRTHPAPSCQECENLKHDLEGYMDANKSLINREWQGLNISDEDNFIKQCYMIKTESEAHQLVLDIEKTLRIKNAIS